MSKCRREEAIRAKEIALKKMDSNDFTSAQRILLEAQMIYPDLENISQLLTICNVHCAANKKVKKEIYLYGILQVDVAADETVIKRQYRKLAMLLHPDKNKFTGAEAAFKLVAEANSVLGNATKRVMYDTRRMNVSKDVPSKGKHQPGNSEETCSKPGSDRPAFWTMCPNCETRYEYHSHVLDKTVHCQNCGRFFSASPIRSPNKQHGTRRKRREHVSPSGGRSKVVKPTKNVGRRSILYHADANVHSRKKLRQKDGSTVPIVEGSSMDVQGNTSEQNCNKKKRKRKNHLSSNVGLQHNEILCSNASSTDRQSASNHMSRKVNIRDSTQTNAIGDEDNIETEATCTAGCDSEALSVPHPSIKFRDVNSTFIGSGQIWALFDNDRDSMPRLYAQVKYIDESNSKVHLNWLRYVVKKKEERKWKSKGLPVACGKFRLGRTDVLEDTAQFSHIVEWKNDKRSKLCVICPNKGQVWALYKEWSMEWTSVNNRYEYEVVQVMTNMSVTNGATVIPLVKIAGFVSLFAVDKDKSPFDIPSTEVFRFSHRIPFYRTIGNEKNIQRKGVSLPHTKEHVPGGFLQLDTSCLSADLDQAFSSVTLNYYMSLSKKTSRDICGDNETDGSFQQEYQPHNIYEYPDPEFHNFEEGCSNKKFQRGQIWALYSDINKFPNFYGRIDKVESEPFRVHLNWLDVCTQSEQEKWWMENDWPISCGTFKVRDSTTLFGTTDVFSHLVDANETSDEWQLEIFPRVGEIWVIYMNWASDWDRSSISSCEFAVGKIIERTEACTKLSFLAKVDGYTSVFQPEKEKGVLEIPLQDSLRFSHRVPSFRLTKERDGNLNGFYELDAASVPDVFI